MRPTSLSKRILLISGVPKNYPFNLLCSRQIATVYSNNMVEENLNSESSEIRIENNLDEIEQDKEKKLLNLIVEILVKTTLKEFYETGD